MEEDEGSQETSGGAREGMEIVNRAHGQTAAVNQDLGDHEPFSGDAHDNDSNNEDDDDDDEDDDEEESDTEPVQSLVSGREKRATAGNRLSTLLNQEADDEVSLLFAEDGEEDVEFEATDEDASDVADDSSSDEDDQGPTAGAVDDDLEGEAELKKEERAAKQAQKRKAVHALARPPTLKKRVKIDDPATASQDVSETSTPKPRKKSERMAWLAGSKDNATRTSSRTLAVMNKQKILANLKENEGRKVRQMAVEGALSKRKVVPKKVLTQEERLAEAAKVEKINSRSLNRWEQAEKERAEKQRARLEALQNRQLAGPVVRWYSGSAEWHGDVLIRVGKHAKIEVVEPEGDTVAPEKALSPDGARKSSAVRVLENDGQADGVATSIVDNEQTQTGGENIALDPSTMQRQADAVDPDAAAVKSSLSTEEQAQAGSLIDSQPQKQNHTEAQVGDDVVMEHAERADQTASPATMQEHSPTAEDSHGETNENDPPAHGILAGIDYYANLPEVEQAQGSRVVTSPKEISSPSGVINGDLHDTFDEITEVTDRALEKEAQPGTTLDGEPTDARQVSPRGSSPTVSNLRDASDVVHDATQPLELMQPVEHVPPSFSTRNLITLLNFDADAIANRDVVRRIIFGMTNQKQADKKPSKMSAAICAITSAPAKYRDPTTLLPYAGLEGYRSIQRLLKGGAVWSDLLGAWVGSEGKVGKAAEVWTRSAPAPVVPTTSAPEAAPTPGNVELKTETTAEG